MGAILRARCRSASRPVLLALLVALAWLVWGAGTATASSPVPDAGDLLKPASAALAKPLPVPAHPAVVSSSGTALATATSLADSAAAAANALAAPALPAVTGTVDTATALVPGLPDLPLVQAPLPLPLPDVLPLPEQLPPLLPAPGIAPLPGLPRTTTAPGPLPTAAPSLPASSAAAKGSIASVSPAPARPVSLAATNTPRFGFGPAQDRSGLASPPEASASPTGPENGPQNPDPRTPPALANGAGTASSGSVGGSEGAADLGGSWPSLPTANSGPHLSGAVTLPAGPSFDPGCSPD